MASSLYPTCCIMSSKSPIPSLLNPKTALQSREQPTHPTCNILWKRWRHVHGRAGLPPIPAKLVTRIAAGEFIDMAKLLPDKLGLSKCTSSDDQAKPNKARRRTVTNILEWMQCFATYMTVDSKKQPEWMPDILGYFILIIEANMEYGGEAWLGYDCRFRQIAASDQKRVWSQSDSTLWDLAFSGKAKANKCCYCFSLTHSSSQCEWAPDLQSTPPQPLFASILPSQFQPPYKPSFQMQTPLRICKTFNFDLRPGCTFRNCSYEHTCWHCTYNPLL